MPLSDDPKIDRFYLAVGERIRGARGVARMTQAHLADRLGFARSSIANVEAGRQRVPLHVFVLIADALNMEPSKLLPEEIDAPAVPDLSNLDEHLADAEASSRDFVEGMLSQLRGNSESDGQ